MPPKQFCFKVNGALQYEKGDSEDDFYLFKKAIDDRYAAILVREHPNYYAPKGRSIIKGIENKMRAILEGSE